MPPDAPKRNSPAVLVADGGVQHHSRVQGDPMAALFELMEVVEALCPEWPEAPITLGTNFRL